MKENMKEKKKTQKEKLEEKLDDNLVEIFNEIKNSELHYEDSMKRVLDYVVWDMKKYGQYNYEQIIKCFFKVLYANNQKLYVEDENYITKLGGRIEETH
tara:strand:+ start:230 stop:526 length:297 start_codon:yes stop_codon:yes gene_type:complete